jgi:gentisate 1,2-dioxygenase
MATLTRHRDGEGFSGSRIQSIDPVTGKHVSHEPTVGLCLLVGSMTAGTFSSRDWWMTTPITEIVSEGDGEMVFKTGNSTYTLKV